MPDTIIHTAYIVGFIWALLALHLLLSKPSDRVAVRLLALNCIIWSIQSVLLVALLQWEWAAAMALRPAIAMLLGPALYLYYVSVSNIHFEFNKLYTLHIAPALAVCLMMFTGVHFLAVMIDYLIIISLGGYTSIILFNLITKGGGNLQHLGAYAKDAYLWLWIVSGMMLISTLSEIAIFIEILLGKALKQSIVLHVSSWAILLFTAFALLCFLRRSPLFEWMYSLGEVQRQKYTQSSLTPEMCDDYFQQLERFMHQECPYKEERVKIADIAKRVKISSRYLSETINRKQGVSFSRYLNDYRIKEAKHLLVQRPLSPITDIMFETGFYTKSSFNKEFMRVEGVSPSTYRKQMIQS